MIIMWLWQTREITWKRLIIVSIARESHFKMKIESIHQSFSFCEAVGIVGDLQKPSLVRAGKRQENERALFSPLARLLLRVSRKNGEASSVAKSLNLALCLDIWWILIKQKSAWKLYIYLARTEKNLSKEEFFVCFIASVEHYQH